MKPYYEDPWATLYHGDAFEILPELPRGRISHCVTDPPTSWLRARRPPRGARRADGPT